MAMEQVLYAQLFMILKKYLDNKNKKETARSKLWFDLDHEQLEEIFSKSEPEFYKNFIK